MSVSEKWVIFTANDTHSMFDIHLVARLERQLKEEGQAYRTIFYRNNKPTKYVVGKGYVVMSRKEENAIIESVQCNASMICVNCDKDISNQKSFYRAGNNSSIYCKKECAYQAYRGFYTRKQVDKTLQKIERGEKR